ncbi:hypothetical protein FKM82_024124 [Ascaphus truei]
MSNILHYSSFSISLHYCKHCEAVSTKPLHITQNISTAAASVGIGVIETTFWGLVFKAAYSISFDGNIQPADQNLIAPAQ